MKAHRVKLSRLIRDAHQGIAAGSTWKIVRLPEWSARRTPRDGITMVSCIKDEGDFLDEWIRFHRHVGVDRFVLYDNGSTDHTADVLEPYVRSGVVRLVPWLNFSVWLNQQRAAFAHAITNFGPDTRWIGFFDIDEFVFPIREQRLQAVLQPREHLPVLCVAGINFGTAGHVMRPPGGVVENYRMGVPMPAQLGVPDLINTKCFVQPAAVAAIPSVHWFELRGDPHRGYTEHGVPLVARPHRQAEAMTVDEIRYNHYFCKSKDDFERKIDRGDARGPSWAKPEVKRKMFRAIESLAVEDRAIDHVFRSMEPVPAPRLRLDPIADALAS